MPKLLDFRIDLEKPGATYFPGEMVHGRVYINLSEPRTARELRTKTRGVSKVHWTEQHRVSDKDGKSHTETRHYTNKEHYFRKLSPLILDESGEHRVTIPAGESSYYFAFPLPKNIPSNFEHQYGHVRYVVKAVIDRPWKIDDTVEKSFTVIAPFRSETLRDYGEGLYDEFDHDFTYCCCFNSGSMKVDVTRHSSVFASGETIELIINIDNHSQVDITNVKLKLKKNLTFIATTKRKDVSIDLKEVHQSRTFRKKDQIVMQLVVPPGPYANLEDCSIIDVRYELCLTIHVSGIYSKIKRYYSIKLYDKVSQPELMPQLELQPFPQPQLEKPPPMPMPMSQPMSQPLPIGFIVPTDLK